MLVNGTPGPFFDVTTTTLRLRILNGSNTPPYNFALSDEREFSVIGTDGGLLEAPVALRELQLSPGERAEVLLTFAAGEVVQLWSGPSDTGDRLAGGADHLDILEFRAADRLGGIAETPDKLVPVPLLRESTARQAAGVRTVRVLRQRSNDGHGQDRRGGRCR